MRRSCSCCCAICVLILILGSGCLSDPTFHGPASDGVEDGAAPVVPGSDAASGATDGPKPRPPKPNEDASVACGQSCANAGGTCNGATCTIACPDAGESDCKNVKCPPGGSCVITCVGKQACDKIDCTGTASCVVKCIGEQACSDIRAENVASTDITCDGSQACNGKVECSGAGCAVACMNQGCKPNEVKCCATQCTVDGLVTTTPCK